MEDGDEIVASDATPASDDKPVPAYSSVRTNTPGRDQLSSTAGEAIRSRVLALAANSAKLKVSVAELENTGGARRNRTADLFNAIEALSQLSYDPGLSEITHIPAKSAWVGLLPSAVPLGAECAAAV